MGRESRIGCDVQVLYFGRNEAVWERNGRAVPPTGGGHALSGQFTLQEAEHCYRCSQTGAESRSCSAPARPACGLGPEALQEAPGVARATSGCDPRDLR